MPYSKYDQYLEAEVLSADPVKLVRMLYRGAIEAVAAARQQLAAGAVKERSRQITKAWEILHELSRALDHSAASAFSYRLAALYAYMQSRLLEANAAQIDAPLAEVQSLLNTLGEAWQTAQCELSNMPGILANEPAFCESSC